MLYSDFDLDTLSLANVLSSINPVELVTPVNFKEQKEHWLINAKLGIIINPSFIYDTELLKAAVSNSSYLAIARQQVEERLIPENKRDEVFIALLLHRIDEAILATEIASSILLKDDLTTCELNHRLYGFPKNSQVVRAYSIIEDEIPLDTKRSVFSKKDQKALKKLQFDAEAIKEYFEKALSIYGFSYWEVEIDDCYTAVDVRDKSTRGSVIGIPSDRKVDGLKLLELIGHEIECHFRGSENCRELVRKLFSYELYPLSPLIPVVAKSDNELFYEGVAKTSDAELVGESGLPTPYATIACDIARRGASFSKTAKIINKLRMKMGQTSEDAISGAWTTTYRIMRGSTNTGVGGYSFSKDYIYMYGYEYAKQLSPALFDFSSLTVDELNSIKKIVPLEPRYPKLGLAKAFKDELLL